MKRSGAVKFPNSVHLFKFCQKVLMEQRGGKVHDQEVGTILSFNPSDCSHWKRGEKNVRSVFALAKLAETLQIEPTLIHDVAQGAVGLDEAFYEWRVSNNVKKFVTQAREDDLQSIDEVREKVENFVTQIHNQIEFSTPPLYIPEVLRHFAFVSTQPSEMIDKLSRILRLKPGRYTIQFRKGDLKPQTRMSIALNLSRIIFEGERGRFPELGESRQSILAFEEFTFAAELLVPKSHLLREMARMDSRRNMIGELAATFWVPKSLIGFQVQELVRRSGKTASAVATRRPYATSTESVTT